MGDIVGELTKAEEQKKTELVFDDGHIEAMAEYKTPEELYQDLRRKVTPKELAMETDFTEDETRQACKWSGNQIDTVEIGEDDGVS